MGGARAKIPTIDPRKHHQLAKSGRSPHAIEGSFDVDLTNEQFAFGLHPQTAPDPGCRQLGGLRGDEIFINTSGVQDKALLPAAVPLGYEEGCDRTGTLVGKLAFAGTPMQTVFVRVPPSSNRAVEHMRS